MRLFSEEDVLRLIGLAQVGEEPQDVIAEGERLGLVDRHRPVLVATATALM